MNFAASTALATLALTGQAMAQSAPVINAAVLPSSRSATMGTPITVFATIVNGGQDVAPGCQASFNGLTMNPAGLSMDYQAMLPDNATPAAGVNAPIDIASGAAQSFILTITGASAFAATDIFFNFDCPGNGSTPNGMAPFIVGVNTLSMLVSATPNPDIITIGTTVSGDGFINIPTLGGAEAMGVAALNIGAGSVADKPIISGPLAGANGVPVIVAPDFGNVELPISLTICETNPVTAECLALPSATVNTVVGDEASTFSVFATSDRGAGVPAFPDVARVFLRFYDDTSAPDAPLASGAKAVPAGAGTVFGATSHAVQSPGPSAAPGSVPVGIWEAFYDLSNGNRIEGLIMVNVDGSMVLDTENPDGTNSYIFGTMTADASASPTPTYSFASNLIDENPDGSFVISPYAGSGTWNPNRFLLGTLVPAAGEAPEGDNSSPSGINTLSAVGKALYSGLYDRNVTLATLAGTYDFLDIDENNNPSDVGDMTIQSNGSFSGSIQPDPIDDPTALCTVSGDISLQVSGKNIFDIDLTVTGCDFAGTYSGAGHQIDEEFPGTTVNDLIFFSVSGALAADGSTVAFSIDAVPQGNVTF